MSGIRDLIPGSVIDATMFNPCGYSMNGMKADVSVSGGGGGEGTKRRDQLALSNACLLFARGPTGPSTSPRSRSSPTSASRPTSPRPPTTIWCGRLWRFSSRGSLLPHFLSIRSEQHSLFLIWFFFLILDLSLSRTCALPAELQMSQCLLLSPEAGGVQARRPPVGPVQRLQLCLHQLRPEPPAEPAELRLHHEEEA